MSVQTKSQTKIFCPARNGWFGTSLVTSVVFVTMMIEHRGLRFPERGRLWSDSKWAGERVSFQYDASLALCAHLCVSLFGQL